MTSRNIFYPTIFPGVVFRGRRVTGLNYEIPDLSTDVCGCLFRCPHFRWHDVRRVFTVKIRIQHHFVRLSSKPFLLLVLTNILRLLSSVQHDLWHTTLMSYNPTFICLNAAGFLFYSSVRNFVSLNMSHGYGYTLLPIVITFEINEVVLYMEDSFLFPSFQNVYKIRFVVGVQRQDSVTYIVTSSQMFSATEDRQPACW